MQLKEMSIFAMQSNAHALLCGFARSRVGFVLLFPVALLASCGGGSASRTIPPSVAPTITAQPASQTVPVNRAAMFSVTAGGTAPLLYQWYRNGAAIDGANEATFNTPVVTLLDNKTTYSVTISNSAGSVTSATVTLLAGPRAPAMGDLRYLQLEQAPLYNNSAYQLSGVELVS